jgi:inner membrane protein
MDPISQGVIGATFSQSFFRRKKILPVGIAGAISGMAADLDVFIRSSIDPLLFLEFHRQFTHSLIFIPIGALVSTLFLFYLLKSRLSWKETYIACFLGYATHALLDACTAYGTQLFWPFSSERIAWNNISIIDPLFTLPLVAFFAIACIKQSRLFAFLGIGWAILYLSIGMIQKKRAFDLGQEIALFREHSAKFLTVKPSFGNLLLWKVIYEFDGSYYVDAIRLSIDSRFCSGQKIEKFNLKKHIKRLKKNSQQALDIERFRKFSAGYLSYKHDQNLVIDPRYSLLPNKISPLWGIVIDPQKKTQDHVEWWNNESPNKIQISEFLALLSGDGCQKRYTPFKKSDN